MDLSHICLGGSIIEDGVCSACRLAVPKRDANFCSACSFQPHFHNRSIQGCSTNLGCEPLFGGCGALLALSLSLSLLFSHPKLSELDLPLYLLSWFLNKDLKFSFLSNQSIAAVARNESPKLHVTDRILVRFHVYLEPITSFHHLRAISSISIAKEITYIFRDRQRSANINRCGGI